MDRVERLWKWIKRKPVIAAGLVVYICAALLAREAESLKFLLAARFLQGLGASGPRIAGVALSRDLYEGREMARVMNRAADAPSMTRWS